MKDRKLSAYDKFLFKEPKDPPAGKTVDIQEDLYKKQNNLRMSYSDKRAEKIANAAEKALEKSGAERSRYLRKKLLASRNKFED